MDKPIKETILKKGLKSIPSFVWSFCASYALIMLTNLFVLNFAHIDADKHINRYMDILLTNKEFQAKPNKELELKVIEQQGIINQLDERLKEVENLSHKPTG